MRLAIAPVCGLRQLTLRAKKEGRMFPREGAKARRGLRLVDIETLASDVVDCGLHLHRQLGPGLLETVYENVLAEQLRRRGYSVRQQVSIDVVVEDIRFDGAFRADLVIDDCLIIEVKSTERNAPVHGKQLLTYLRLSHMSLGFVMNFGCETFREGLRRVVNKHPFAPSRLRVETTSSSPAAGLQ
jgi:GxxExxY protein